MMYGSCTDTVLARIVSPHFDDVLAKRQKACWTLLVYRPILTCLLVGYAQRNYNKKNSYSLERLWLYFCHISRLMTTVVFEPLQCDDGINK